MHMRVYKLPFMIGTFKGKNKLNIYMPLYAEIGTYKVIKRRL